MGSVDTAMGCSFEQLVIDAYIWECIRDFRKQVEIAEERIGLDAALIRQGDEIIRAYEEKLAA